MHLNNDAISILNDLMNLDIKASMAFRLMRIIKELSTIIEFKIKAEKMIIDKWAIRDSNGDYLPIIDNEGAIVPGTIKISDMNNFEKEMSELLDVENTILFDKINFDDLGIVTNIKPKDLLKIDFIFI